MKNPRRRAITVKIILQNIIINICIRSCNTECHRRHLRESPGVNRTGIDLTGEILQTRIYVTRATARNVPEKRRHAGNVHLTRNTRIIILRSFPFFFFSWDLTSARRESLQPAHCLLLLNLL